MLYFDIKRVLELRGIERPYTFFLKNGFVSQTAANLANNRVGHVKPEQMEKLCFLLNCTPNDLFDWQPDNKTVVPENHALRTLSKSKTASFTEMVKDLPVEKLSQLEAVINELKKDE
jgi:hypothetical protein